MSTVAMSGSQPPSPLMSRTKLMSQRPSHQSETEPDRALEAARMSPS